MTKDVWAEIEENDTQSGDFVKLKSGEKVKLHVLDVMPETFVVHWNDKTGRSENCKGETCASCEKGIKGIQKFRVPVWNYATKRKETLEQGRSVFGQLRTIRNDNGQTLAKVDVLIRKTGSGLETEYSVMDIETVYAGEAEAQGEATEGNGKAKTEIPF